MKNKKVVLIIIAVIIILAGFLVVKAVLPKGEFTLSGDDLVKSEEIQPLKNTIEVFSDRDCNVVFTDIETGQKYEIGYLTKGLSVKIDLSKGKWYKVESSGTITVLPVNVRIQ